DAGGWRGDVGMKKAEMPRVSEHRRVLVVDDELLIRWSLTETLQDRGYTVFEAEDGKGAVLALTSGAVQPDVVLLDFRLPDSNDLTLLSRIISLVPKGRVILMTAYGTPDLAQAERVEGGADDQREAFGDR
ncbi:MAG: response regulator, partial [Candidatus Promineofilum sp.]|nr:response regulator [Promineifilum sp.]